MPNPATEPRKSAVGFPIRGLLGVLATIALLAYLFVPDVTAWQHARAERRAETDPAGALREVEESLKRNPTDLAALQLRMKYQLRLGDVRGAIGTLDTILQRDDLSLNQRIALLAQRAELHQQVDQHIEAIRDANEMLKIMEANASGTKLQREEWLMLPRNQRAYTIARAAAAGHANPELIASAQREMQQVFAALAKQHARLSADDISAMLDYWHTEASYLDTAAYLEMSAGNLRGALRDFNRVLELCDWLELAIQRAEPPLSSDEVRLRQQMLAVPRAVALHHRGEVQLKLGNQAAGEQDIELAKRLGYNKEAGVW